MLLAAWSTVAVDQRDRLLDHPGRELRRIFDGGGAADERRVRAVILTDALQPAHHIGNMAAEHAPVHVQLIDNDVFEVLEESNPARVMRQDTGVQHVRVGDDDMAGAPYRPPRRLWCVTVVRVGLDVCTEHLDEPVELCDLILRQGLGWEEVQSARRLVPQDGVERRHVIAEGLAGGGGRYDDHVLPPEGCVYRPRLMGVETVDTASSERGA